MDYREPLETGTVLADDYRIEQVLGAGGFGITYLAQDTKLGRAVAIKEYFPAEFALREASRSVRPRSGERAETFRWGYDSFIREAQFLARFDHPAISRVLRVIEANDTAYMVLRYEEGRPLAQHLEALGRPMTEVEIRRLIYPVLEALEIVHAQGILHRDISPENIIVRPDGRGVLIDFGAARQAVAGRSRLMTGIVRESYSAPEQYSQGGPKQGPWTDVYGLGAVLYRAVTGRQPLTSPHRMIEDAQVPAAGHEGSHMLAAIDHALRLRPAERPQSIGALRRAMSGQAPEAETSPAPALVDVTVVPKATPASPVVVAASHFEKLSAGAAQPRPGGPAAATLATPPAAQARKSQRMSIWALLFSFRGRINRAKVWAGVGINLVLLVAGVLAARGIGIAINEKSTGDTVVGILAILVLAVTTWIAFALYAKRAHDRGWSGWFALLTLVPLLQFWPLIEFLFLPGESGPNRFGPDPFAPATRHLAEASVEPVQA